MIAQCYSTVDIHAIDVDTAAAAEAHFNFKNSPWTIVYMLQPQP